ncbi:hypothetical protein ACFL6M_03990, partial [Candidatus Eisenbacteria bacterium]
QKFGGSEVSHNLPPVSILGSARSLSLTYASHTVQPKIVIETATTGVPLEYSLPQYTGAQANVAGRRFTGIIEASRDTTKQRIRFDARGTDGEFLPTGLYHFGDVLANFSFSEYATADSFGAPPSDSTGVRTDFPVGFETYAWGDLLVNNLAGSELGSGWAIGGLQRLLMRPDGDAMITEGGLASRFYDRTFAAPILDLVVLHNTHVTILLGDGMGGFEDPQNWPSGGGGRNHRVRFQRGPRSRPSRVESVGRCRENSSGKWSWWICGFPEVGSWGRPIRYGRGRFQWGPGS